jgi:uncharacterized protein (DUF433 family)
MSEFYSVREAAVIAEVSPETIRTALEKRAVAPSQKQRTGRAVRYGFSVRDVLLLKLLTEFPFPLARADKRALRTVLVRREKAFRNWQMCGSDLVFSAKGMNIIVECKQIRQRLANNVATFHWGKRRIVADPRVLSGEPVFEGTRIPLDHIAGLLRKGLGEREVHEDFPQLSARDLAFAKLYARLGPGPGRPKKQLEVRRKTQEIV